MIGIPLGLAASNATEWLVHKYVLHGRGRDKRSFWAFHWHEHHRNARRGDHFDPDYERPLFARWNGQSKEAVALVAAALAVAPLFPIAPFFVGTVTYCAANYYRKHKRAHLDPAWARAHLPWHYDHHMGPDQHANWCVTRPWFDHVMGTRAPYVGTERERLDLDKRARRAATTATTESAPAAAPDPHRGRLAQLVHSIRPPAPQIDQRHPPADPGLPRLGRFARVRRAASARAHAILADHVGRDRVVRNGTSH